MRLPCMLLSTRCCPCVLQELPAWKALEILKRISDEDCEAMGFRTKVVRPDWMILQNVPVPPPPVRPSVMMDSSARCAGTCCAVLCRSVLCHPLQRPRRCALLP